MTKQLAVYDDSNGRLYGIDPVDATGVPIPAFRYGGARPAVGGLKGQAFISTITGIASVWDGANWIDIAKPVIQVYQDDATLLADSPPDDTPALSTATGNFYVRTQGSWKQLGIMQRPTQAALLASTAGTGQIAYAADTKATFLRDGGVWTPTGSGVVAQEADLLAGTAPWDAGPTGLVIVAQDTGRMFVRIGNDWFPYGVKTFATEVALTNTAGSEGMLAFAVDTGRFVVWASNQWNALTHQGVQTGPTAPTAAVAGNLWLDVSGAKSELKFYDGTSWVGAGSGMEVGSTAPTSPAADDVWLDTGNNVLKYHDGTNWVESGGTANFVQDHTPTNPKHGSFWFATTTGRLFVYEAKNDPNGVWISVT